MQLTNAISHRELRKLSTYATYMLHARFNSMYIQKYVNNPTLLLIESAKKNNKTFRSDSTHFTDKFYDC